MKWVKKIINQADKIYVHFETKENINEVRNYIIQRNKDFGIALTLDTNPKNNKYIKKILWTSNFRCKESQAFQDKVLITRHLITSIILIDYISGKKFRLCIDGGVNKEIARVLEVDDLVSNSYILASNNPAVEIDDMKNSDFNMFKSEYEIKKTFKNLIFSKLSDTNIISLSFVGSFTGKKSYRRLNDINLIIIVKNLNSKNLNKIKIKLKKLNF